MTSSDNEVLIKVDNVSKKFCRDFKKSLWYGLKDTASDIFNFNSKDKEKELPHLREGEFWANQNISFEVKRGECLGLIGHNGAGKTTLLKMLNGLIKPDTGSIEMCGKVGAMIALGAGFNPILTGRENIYVNGSILGIHKKEIDSKISEIIDFAEIEDAIDAPVRTYSSGMMVRLGFAVSAILIQPDVLILDEVLAVGDINFTTKCLNAVRQLAEQSAVILVSHNVGSISQFCNRVMLLKHGRTEMITRNVGKGLDAYLSICEDTVEIAGTREIKVTNEVLWTVTGGEVSDPRSLLPSDSMGISMDLDIADTIDQSEVRIALMNRAGDPVATFVTENESGARLQLGPGKHHCRFEIGCLGLSPGRYHILIVATVQNPERICLRQMGLLPFNILETESRGYISASLSLSAKAIVS